MKSLQELVAARPGFADRRPALPPWPPVDLSGPDVPERRSNGQAWLLPFLALALLAAYGAALGVQAAGAGERTAFLYVVRDAALRYRADHGTLPPGDGLGSAALRRALTTPGPRGVPYLVVTLDQVGRDGHLLDPEGRRVLYRPGSDGKPELTVEPPYFD